MIHKLKNKIYVTHALNEKINLFNNVLKVSKQNLSIFEGLKTSIPFSKSKIVMIQIFLL